MSLFKVFRGKEPDLDAVEKVDGHAYFTTDTGGFFIDYEDNGTLLRKQVTSKSLEGTSFSDDGVIADEALSRGNLVFVTQNSDGEYHAVKATQYTELKEFDIGFVKADIALGETSLNIDFVQRGHPERCEVVETSSANYYRIVVHGPSNIIATDSDDEYKFEIYGEPTIYNNKLFIVP